MMHGSDDWPIPAPRTPEATHERVVRALPAVFVALALHAIVAWTLLREAAPWQRLPVTVSSATAIEIEFFEPTPPAPAIPEQAATTERADAIPFPTTRPTIVDAATEIRESTQREPTDTAPIVHADRLFGDIASAAADLSRPDTSSTPRGNARLPGRSDPFSAARIRFKPPPLTPEQIATRVARMLVSTTAANSTTGLMGTVPGRDPGRELQRAHHDGMYLPRGCDDPDDPNLSNECMGIPKR
ncbi:MAG: hypothetical protein KA505_02110 [Xanthomonadales bacterium]|nr:hypothetical protein [Xanthomonadales bacterium]